MAQCYYDMTGVLVLDKVTPVIKALFGPFNLDEKYPGNGEAYIAKIAEDNSTSWQDVLDGLQDLIEHLGLSLPSETDDTMEEHLYLLATHFGADQNEDLHNLIEQNTFEDDDADLGSLFEMALAFNDGHGLKGYRVEAAWHCSKPQLGEFGGSGHFVGRHVSVAGSSDQFVRLGEALEKSLETKDIDQAAALVLKEVERCLAGINDQEASTALRLKLGALLSTPKDTPLALCEAIQRTEKENGFVEQVAHLSIWDYDKNDGTPYLECEEPAEGYTDSHSCLMNLIESARRLLDRGQTVQPT